MPRDYDNIEIRESVWLCEKIVKRTAGCVSKVYLLSENTAHRLADYETRQKLPFTIFPFTMEG